MDLAALRLHGQRKINDTVINKTCELGETAAEYYVVCQLVQVSL